MITDTSLSSSEYAKLTELTNATEDAVTQVLVCQDTLRQARTNLASAQDRSCLARHALQTYLAQLRREGKQC
jgi:hypothetical protein